MTALRLWLDDLRPAPEGWEWARSAPGAIIRLQAALSGGETIERISFDHDLGYRGASRYVLEEHDSRQVMLWLESQVAAGELVELPVLEVHSANPVGRSWLERAFAALPRLRERLHG